MEEEEQVVGAGLQESHEQLGDVVDAEWADFVLWAADIFEEVE